MELLDMAVLAGAVLILLGQSTWLYTDARGRSRYPWFWAIWGLIQCPMPLIFYWLIVRRRKR
ncbi:sigmaY antisigma factor component [Cohnella fermenti]|uniref:SigmaY antisigma factor component n=1 Tax=Cohnella fermenti TaxID=2565925 RepID=A0A4S4C227_9BACL|nr:sigmaY antisigma factor component [Cohnella fermenti]THF81656.1 sigmaY antisigma factor component [Cohnella fermenti]